MTTFSSGATLNEAGEVVRVVDATPPPDSAPSEAPSSDAVDVSASDSSEVDASDATELDESPAEADSEGEAPPLSRRQRRRQRYEAQLVRENETLRRNLAVQAAHNEYLLRQVSPSSAPAQPQPGPVPPPASDPTEPQQGDYENWTDYLKALARWTVQVDAREKAAQEAQQREAFARQTAQEQWAQREAEGRETYDDYDEVVSRLSLRDTVAPIVADTFRESEQGHAILYYLGQHPKDVQHLNSLSPLAAARWLGQLETRVGPPVTHSPRARPLPAPNGLGSGPPATAPMAPVGTGGSVPPPGFRQGMSLAEYERMRNQERQRPR